MNFAFFQLRQRGQGSHSTCTNFINLIGQHLAKRWDGLSLNGGSLAEDVVGDGAEVLGRHLSDLPVRGAKVHIESLQHRCVEKQARSQVTLEQDVHELKDQDKDDVLALSHQLVNEDAKNVCIDDRSDSVDKLGQVDEACVGVMADLADLVVKEVGNDSQGAAGNDRHSTLFRVGNLQDGTRSELANDIVLLTAAVDEAHEDARVESLVQLVSLMEVFVNFDEDFLAKHEVVALHLVHDFV